MMVRRVDPDPTDHDERLGEAIETYLALVESESPPDPEEFAGRYPDLSEDLRAALDGLSLVRGLVGAPAGGGGHGLESGQRVAGYRIVRELGRGGMGVVYEAVHVGLDRPVALKVLGSHAAPDSNGRRRFLNEARTAAGLHHTHIVPVFDVGQVGGLCYYAMQRIEGSGLDRVLRHLRRDRVTGAGSTTGATTSGASKSGGALALSGAGRSALEGEDGPPPFEPPRGSSYYRWVAGVGRMAAEALAFAHQRGVVHRDVKPSNLLIDARGTVWVADFGLARRLTDPALTQYDSLLGTPRYMSPEQARPGPLDGRTDVYSLGATLYELLTLHPPFEGRTAAELVEQISGREPPPPRRFDPKLPRDLETIVLKALAKRPADRYASAADLADDLGRFLNHEPVRARRIGPIGRLWRVARRHPVPTATASAAAVAVLAIATVAYGRVLHERDEAIKARRQTQEALREVVAAKNATQAAMRAHLWREATVVRMSNVPNRRTTGLGLLKEATALGPAPDPDLRDKLRNEVIQFLILRDVEAGPAFATGRARALAFNPEGTRLAVLSDDGEELGLWNVASRRRIVAHPLVVAATAPEAGNDPDAASRRGNFGGNRRRGGFGPSLGPGVAVVGPRVVAVVPDGQGLRLFDAVTGTAAPDVATPGRHVLALFTAPEGQRLVTIETTTPDGPPGEFPPPPRDFRINLWDLDEGPAGFETPLATLEHAPAEGFAAPLVALSADGKTVATGRTRGKTVALWSADDGRSLGVLETQTELSALALGPHGQLAVAGGGAIRLWDLESRAPLSSLSPNQSFVRLLRYSPNGALLAAIGGNGTEVELWDAAAHALVAVLPASERVFDVAFAPDGITLAAAGQAATTTVWTVIPPAARVQLSGFDAPISAAAFRDDGLLALGGRNGSVQFWRPGRGLSAAAESSEVEPKEELPAAGPAPGRGRRDRSLALAFVAQGRLIGWEADTLRLWNQPGATASVKLASLPRDRGNGFRGPAGALARTADGRTLFLARPNRVLVWRADAPEQLRPLKLPPPPVSSAAPGFGPGRGGPVGWRALVASPRGDRLYLLDSAGAVHVFAVAGNDARRLDWSLPESVASLALSPDGDTLALCERSGKVALVETVQGATTARLVPPGEAEGFFWPLAFAPDGRALAVGTQQGQVLLWSLDHPDVPQVRLPSHRGFVTALAYDPKGRYLATVGSDTTVDVWDLERIQTEMGRLGLAW